MNEIMIDDIRLYEHEERLACVVDEAKGVDDFSEAMSEYVRKVVEASGDRVRLVVYIFSDSKNKEQTLITDFEDQTEVSE